MFFNRTPAARWVDDETVILCARLTSSNRRALGHSPKSLTALTNPQWDAESSRRFNEHRGPCDRDSVGDNPEVMINIELLDRAGCLGRAKNNHIIIVRSRAPAYVDPCLCVSILSSVRSEQFYSPIDPTNHSRSVPTVHTTQSETLCTTSIYRARCFIHFGCRNCSHASQSYCRSSMRCVSLSARPMRLLYLVRVRFHGRTIAKRQWNCSGIC